MHDAVAKFDHDLLPFRRDPGETEELVLEDQRGLAVIDLDALQVLLAPLDVNCNPHGQVGGGSEDAGARGCMSGTRAGRRVGTFDARHVEGRGEVEFMWGASTSQHGLCSLRGGASKRCQDG